MKPNSLLEYETEITKLKKNNRNLAKALVNQQEISKKYLNEVNMLTKKLFTLSALNMHYEKIVSEIFTSTNTTMQLCQEGLNLQKLSSNRDKSLSTILIPSVSTSNSHKTHAVKPMVGGHVILHPTINLSRLTDINITSEQYAGDSVEQHSTAVSLCDIERNREMVNQNGIRTLSKHLPVRNLAPEYLGDENEESLEDSSLDFDNNSINDTRRVTLSLDSIEEECENVSLNNSLVKEVRIVIEPLALEDNISLAQQKNSDNIARRKRRVMDDDPLEGTSTLLDEIRKDLSECNYYVSKPRQASNRVKTNYCSESEESVISEKKNKRQISQSNVSSERKDVTGQKYKIKKKKVSQQNEENQNTDISTTNSRLEENTTLRNTRRTNYKSYAEPSLRRKLRR